MKNDVTAIPDDSVVIVDGLAIHGISPFPEVIQNLHALQWHNNTGTLEIKPNFDNIHFDSKEEYELYVQPFVDVHSMHKAYNHALRNEEVLLEPFIQ